MKIFDRLTVLAVRTAIKEVRKLREVLQAGVDSYRLVHGMSLLYNETPVDPGMQDDLDPPTARKPIIGRGDFLTVYLIEELAREFHIPLSVDVDLEQLALDRGWVNEDGKFLMLPLSVQREMSVDELGELVASSAVKED